MAGERQVTCTKDDVLAKLSIELLFERLLYVNRREHAKAFRFERFSRLFDRLFVRYWDRDAHTVGRFLHGSSNRGIPRMAAIAERLARRDSSFNGRWS